ncbi:MAG TPA: type I-E CRISPR-associated protein Cse2/CasB [Methanoregulaceae archaeon]|nr:MAG: type I-E CRISPR-associated protein Cse2/CasB [Methanolinea sp.]HON81885.1 type I-E CRISPR-associated protein Cse2/CasB [Methanoregulaceae archaeon]HPD10608.1 type I-E CRISPR-associated protein Cse2/CasB [Methanoregulaceae archaeon]HRT15740.1 type I-E CRISPR-associated protein Cse2/CasB [Methanoregulaceae archaeon]HRU31254.1 type I-E CRISPR-associated protein Cse2/CasB [Methanoregulaceae archaeon]
MIKEKVWLNFNDPHVSGFLLQWWEDLDKRRGDRAELRRCKLPEEVLFLPSYYRLRLPMIQYDGFNDTSLGTVAGVVSHAKRSDSSERFAEQLAKKPPGGDSPVMSELRFRKFLSIREPNALFREGIRAVRLLDGVVNIPDLAQGLYWWKNSRTRQEWARFYYEKTV